MGCLGRHLALKREQVERLREIAYDDDADDSEEAVWDHVQEIEEDLPDKYIFDTDKAWDAIHRALCLDDTGEGHLDPEAGNGPFSLVIIGGEQLCEENYSVCVVEPDEVAGVASVLARVEEAWFRKRYFTLDPKATQYDIDEDDLDYAWGNFAGLAAFFARAAAEGRFVVFSVDH
jgi:hypothetical protein